MTARPITALVTDRRRYGVERDAASDRLVSTVQHAARAGVDLIQVRERGLSDRDLLQLVRRMVAAVEHTAALVLVNDRTDVAIAAGAAGVHLRASSPGASRIRTIAPSGFLIGRSVHDEEAAIAAEQEGGCDYLLFGTVFPSASKPPGHPVAGLGALQQVCARVRLPVLAIGGITLDRLEGPARAGAAGVAAIGLFAGAPPTGSETSMGPEGTSERCRLIVEAVRHAFHAGGG